MQQEITNVQSVNPDAFPSGHAPTLWLVHEPFWRKASTPIASTMIWTVNYASSTRRPLAAAAYGTLCARQRINKAVAKVTTTEKRPEGPLGMHRAALRFGSTQLEKSDILVGRDATWLAHESNRDG